MSAIGIKRKENKIILSYIDDNFIKYKTSISDIDSFISAQCKGNIDLFMMLIQDSDIVVNERGEYVFLEIKEIPEFIYFLSKKNENSLLYNKIKDFESKMETRIYNLEKEINKMKRIRQSGQVFIT